MTQSEQAQKGFKTFILTLSISLIVFSAIYYVITNSSVNKDAPDIDTADKVSTGAGTVFGKLANQKVNDVQSKNVLAGSDVVDTGQATPTPTPIVTMSQTSEPTQASGTPNGGVTSITFGLITSIAVFMYGMFVISKDPRRMAIKGFESSITKDL